MKEDIPQKRKKIRVKSNHTLNRKVSISWVITTILLTFVLSVSITVITSSLLGNVAMTVAFLILLSIVFLGIVFDILGIAVTTAAEAPFHAMASNRVPGAVQSIRLIRNAEKVSNFCNDVVGDICGIVSGATGSFIAAQLVTNYSLPSLLTSLFVTGVVSALTVGGKALGKTLAINQCNQFVFGIGKILAIFSPKLKKSRKNHG
ncbi:MAG: Mg2+ and Co2+ transporter CorB [Clostridia bacterium]|nr:Mg2+ and Co2+ transporter CorB [Clostridia bacterium]